MSADACWFPPFYREHHRAVRAVVYRFGIRNDLDDVVQEIFLKAFRARAGFRHESSDRTWLLRIAINAAKDFIRRHRHELKPSGIDGEAAIAAPAATSSAPNFLTELIDQGIRLLTEPLHAALILNVLEGYTTKETATILEIPEGTVKSRVAAARVHMKAFLAEHGVKP